MTEIRRTDTSPLVPVTRATGKIEAPPVPPGAPAAAGDSPRIAPGASQAQHRAALKSEANRAVVTAGQATKQYISAAIGGDAATASRAQDLAASQLARYQDVVGQLGGPKGDYRPPTLPQPDHEQLVRQGLLKKFEGRLAAAKGDPIRQVGAEFHNDMEAIGTGLVSGSQHLWQSVVHFIHHPVGDAKTMFVDAASLLLHPIRNMAHAMQAMDRFGDKSHYEQLMDVADALPTFVLAPSIVPVLAEAKEGIRHSEELADQRLLTQIARDGASAPAGRTAIGTAVNHAVVGMHNGTLDAAHVLTSGVIDDIWMNRPDGKDDGISKVCELIRTEAKQEVSFQTYIFDSDSNSAKELLTTLAAKQKENPDFKIHIVVDHPGIEKELVKYGIHADVAAARPLISRRGQHTKMFVIDGKTGVIGGDNVDNPKEKDLLIKVHGPVVQSMLADFDSAWKASDKHFNGTATPPTHPADASAAPANAVPMTMLSKQGVLGFYAKDYQSNDADQGILAAFAAARSEIKLQSPNLNSDPVLAAIRAAAERGVHVKINIPLDYNALGASIDAASNRAFMTYLADLPPSTRANIEVRNFSTNGKEGEQNHTKFLAIDGQWAYVGSQNMDNQSFSFSRELGIGIDDPVQAQRLASQVFDKDWATSLPVEPSMMDRLIPHAVFDH